MHAAGKDLHVMQRQHPSASKFKKLIGVLQKLLFIQGAGKRSRIPPETKHELILRGQAIF